MFVIGSFFGSLSGGIQSQFLGRKKSMLMSNIILTSGILCLRFGTNLATLFIGQFINGFSSQCLTTVIPAYTGEISQPHLRKFTATFFMTFFNIGSAIMFGLCAMFRLKTALFVVIVMSSINFILLMFCPKSSTWLLSKGKHEEAFNTIKRLRGNEIVANAELDRLEENMKKQMAQSKAQENTTEGRR